ncbi:chromosome-anchoring protein RacA [Bacillus sp. FJAT-45350]|uniref:chromosome-anchoring protein RacA n=1 Tax=Bacillus sp. FJAT-45350 TaxID=2011014 RepID=UPI000BB8EC29|nr:chromosome-anchoring protein RacA [Bacillus sp. FJAT-45350]
MESVLKTKDVSELLGVNPTTVQRWVKHFNVECELNESGHYTFSKEQVEILRDIKTQLNEGKRMREVQLGNSSTNEAIEVKREERVSTFQYEKQIKNMMEKIERLEERLELKADEVVGYQILRHRDEIEQMMNMLKSIDERVTSIENSLESSQLDIEETMPMIDKKVKKRSLLHIFSLISPR